MSRGDFTYEDFIQFHVENPKVYGLMLTYTRQLRAQRNFLAGSIWLVGNRVRWEVALNTSDPDFKLPNGVFAYYARLIMRNHPELVGFFKTKRLKDGEPDWTEFVLCRWCKEHGAMVLPVIWPREYAGMVFDHMPECPVREVMTA